MIHEAVIDQFRRDRDARLRSAKESLQRLADDVRAGRNNQQSWQDAERALVRYWDAAGVVAILEEEQFVEQNVKGDDPNDPDVKMTDEFFASVEPGSVSEKEYQRVLDGIRRSRNYLAVGSVYRVEYNIAYGMCPRVNFMEASSEEDARRHGNNLRGGVRIVSCRRATVEEDLEEYVELVADEEGWD